MRILCILLICIWSVSVMADIPGGYTKQSPTSVEIQKIAEKATTLIQKKHPGYTLVKVHEAATQVVAGINYHLVIEFATAQESVLLEIYLYETLRSGEVSLTREKVLKKEQYLDIKKTAEAIKLLCLQARSQAIAQRKNQHVAIVVHKQERYLYYLGKDSENPQKIAGSVAVEKPEVDIVIFGFHVNGSAFYCAGKVAEGEKIKAAIKQIKKRPEEMQKTHETILLDKDTKIRYFVTLNATTGQIRYTTN